MTPTRSAAVLFAIALVPRFLLLGFGPWGDVGRAASPDSYRYLDLARNVEAYRTFGLANEEPAGAWQGVQDIRRGAGTLPPRDANGLYPEVLRTPGYPVLLAGALAVGDVRAALILQCVLGAAGAAVLAGYGRALGLAPRAAFAAGLLWALHPGLIVRDCQFMTESTFNAFGLFGLYLAACGPRGWKGWLLAGACLGFAGLVRPLAVLFLPAALAAAFRRGDRRWLAGAAIAAAACLPSAAWAARNAAVGNGFRVSSVGEVTFLYYFAGYTVSEERGDDWVAAWPRRSDELNGKLRPRVRAGDDVFGRMRVVAAEELAARPGVAATVLAKSWAKLYLTHSVGELYHLCGAEYRPTNLLARYVLREDVEGARPSAAAATLPVAWVGLNAVIAAAAGYGGVVALRRRPAFAAPLLLTIGLFTAATMSQGMERFRTPFQFALLLLAVAPFGLPRKSAGIKS